jgi:hypothetical protein
MCLPFDSVIEDGEPRVNVPQLLGRRVKAPMIILGDPDDKVDHIGKAGTTLAALFESAKHLGRYDDLPGIGLQKFGHDRLDLLVGDDIAMANEHGKAPRTRRQTPGSGIWQCMAVSLENGVGAVEAIRAFDGDAAEIEHGNDALDSAGLVDQGVDR